MTFHKFIVVQQPLMLGRGVTTNFPKVMNQYLLRQTVHGVTRDGVAHGANKTAIFNMKWAEEWQKPPFNGCVKKPFSSSKKQLEKR
jgi:hypothetical protein